MPTIWLRGGFGWLCPAFLSFGFWLLHFPEGGFFRHLPLETRICAHSRVGRGCAGRVDEGYIKKPGESWRRPRESQSYPRRVSGECPASVRRVSHETPRRQQPSGVGAAVFDSQMENGDARRRDVEGEVGLAAGLVGEGLERHNGALALSRFDGAAPGSASRRRTRVFG